MNETSGEWLSIDEAAEILGCSRRTIHRWVDENKVNSRVDYEGRQARRWVSAEDIRRKAGAVQKREQKTEIVTRGATSENADFVIRQLTKVVTGYSRKIAVFVLGIVILGGVTITFVVIRHTRQVQEEISGGVSQGLSQVQAEFSAGLNAARGQLLDEIAAIRTAAEAGNREAINQGERAAAILAKQAETIDSQKAEIELLRAEVAGLVAGVESLRESVTRPTPEPAEAEAAGGDPEPAAVDGDSGSEEMRSFGE